MKKLKTILPFNYFHYYAISVLIALLSYELPILLVLFYLLYKLIKDYKRKVLVICLGVLVYLCLFIINLVPKKFPNQKDRFTIIERIDKENYYQYTAKQKNSKYIFNLNEYYDVGDILRLEFSYEEYQKEKTPGAFNAKKYYSSIKVFYKLNIKKVEFIKKTYVLTSLKYNLLKRLNNYPPLTKSYLETLLLAHNSFDGDFKSTLSKTGISHLFALSGLHLSFLIIFLEKIFFKSKHKQILIIIILTVYVVVTGFPVSLLRAYLMYLLLTIFKEEKMTSLDALSLSFLLMLINPYIRYNLGFVLSFLVSFFVIIIGDNFFKISIVAFLVSLPFVINFNGGILPFSLLISLFIAYLFPYIFIPLMLVSLISFIAPLTEYFYSSFNSFLNYFSNSYFIKIHHFSLLAIIIYFAILIFVLFDNNDLIKIKRSKWLILFLVGSFYYPYLNPQGYIYFLDVNQGDATFISRPFNKTNILIDANKGTYEFLKTRGNIEIDYFFITHGDLDHSADAVKILREFKVHNLYINYFDNTNVIKNLSEFGLLKIKEGTFVSGDILIKVFGPNKDYLNVNENSLVLKLTIDNKNYLFTGDSGFKREQDLIKYSELLQSDYLHVGHHGANTSTSLDFLKVVKPKVAIISSGVNNYNHPHPETIFRITSLGIKIRQTKLEQTITIKKYQLMSFSNSFVIQKKSFSV